MDLISFFYRKINAGFILGWVSLSLLGFVFLPRPAFGVIGNCLTCGINGAQSALNPLFSPGQFQNSSELSQLVGQVGNQFAMPYEWPGSNPFKFFQIPVTNSPVGSLYLNTATLNPFFQSSFPDFGSSFQVPVSTPWGHPFRMGILR